MIRSRIMKFSALKAAVVMTLAGVMYLTPAMSAQRVVVGVGPGYRPGLYGYGGGPGWGYGPGSGPAYGPYRYNNRGTVKLETERKDAKVYVDGGYAGPTSKMKKFDLPQGNHDIELRDSDNRTFYQERVHVIAGRTVKIHVG